MRQTVNFFAIRNVKTTSLLTVILTVSASVLFLLSFASAVPAVEGAWGPADTISGKITAVDVAHPTKSLTLQSSESGLSAPNNEMNIFLTEKTVVQMCYAARSSSEDLKPGVKAQVTYHEIAGLAVADFIYKPC
jgi:hypothetical protein